MRRPTSVALVVALIVVAVTAIGACRPAAGSMIGPEEALTMVEEGEAIIVDVRDLLEYEEVHIAGAIASPFHALDSAEVARIREYGRTAITYCACPAEETSLAAADVLIRNGFDDVLVLKGGIQGWAELAQPLRYGMRP